MKIAIILGSFSIGTRPLDFNNIWTNPRGLTGTDLCFVEISNELKKLGHEIHMFTVHTDALTEWQGMQLHSERDRFDISNDFDCILSINEPNVLFDMAKSPVRIVWEMLNDFSFVRPDFEKEVDVFIGVCDQHTQHLKTLTSPQANWETVNLGCKPNWYKDERVPGRVIWCSSADRGLHWLLSQWPTIRAAVPNASLKIFYHFNYGNIETVDQASITPQGGPYHHHIQEMAQRIRYMKQAIHNLQNFGVEHVGSVSRQQMQKEWNQASVFGFSCDTVAFSEGFSVSTLEAHASFTVPVITDTDCLGSIYGNSGSIMIKDIRSNINSYTSAIIKALSDQAYADDIIDKCRTFAAAHTWAQSALKIQDIIIKYKEQKDGLRLR